MFGANILERRKYKLKYLTRLFDLFINNDLLR